MMRSSAGTTSVITRPLRPDRGDDGIAPGARLRLALGEQLAHQVVQRRDDGAERHVALQLVELAADEIAELLAERRAHLAHQRGLADAGRAREHHQLGATRGRAAERHGQRVRSRGCGRTALSPERSRRGAIAGVSSGRARSGSGVLNHGVRVVHGAWDLSAAVERA